MALTDKLTAIANAIRAKSGKTNTLTLDQMPIEIAALSAEEQLKSTEYPSYITPEVLNVVNNVRTIQKDDSITFIAVSDSHYPAEQAATSDYTNNKASSIQANKAIKSMAYLLDVDFVAHLGDVSTGASTTTPDMLKSQIEGFLSYFKEAKSDIPVFLAVGNHDGGIYYHEAKADGTNYCMTGEYLYDIFTSQSASDNTVFGDTTYGGYCYRDFTDKKLRVFLLNTSEGMAFRQTDSCTLAAQRLWFANALLDLNTKSDATDWGFVVLCHYPADYGGTMPLSELFKAYVTGGSITITGNADESFTSTSVNFSGKNSAKFIAQFHGHVHNFKTSKLYSYATGSGVQYDAWRMCIPNCQYNRENYYTTVGSYTDINFSEDVSYNKTANTADGTTFVINVINPSEEKIYSFCYGAGYDRVIGYGSVAYYSISRDLANVTSDNTAVSVEEGKSYSEIITLTSGYDMKTVTVTMGGVDISSTAISIVDGAYHINISEVTGNIVITAKAIKPPTTNLGLFAEAQDSTAIYNNGLGYKNGYYTTGISEAAQSGYVLTGWIPYETTGQSVPEPIEIKGVTLDDNDSYCRAYFCTADKATVIRPYVVGGTDVSWSDVYTIETLGTKHYKLTPIATSWGSWIGNNGITAVGAYMRFCLKGSGEDFIVNIGDNEVIAYNITYNLFNVASSNTATSIEKGESYSTTFTLKDSYALESVTVTMGGIDITDSAYSNGEISIDSVTGNIVITAAAKSTASYTNLIPLSTTTIGGTEIYNSPYGYKTGYRINSNNEEVAISGMCCTGYMPTKQNDVIRIKNITVAGTATPYLLFRDSAGVLMASLSTDVLTNGGSDSNNRVTAVIEDDIIVITINYSLITSFRLSCGVIDDTSIITVNEEIIDNTSSEWIGQNLKGKTITFTLADISNAFDDTDKQVFYIDDNNKIEASESGATGHYYAYTDVYFGGESMGANNMRSGSITYTFPNDVDAIVIKHDTEYVTVEISDSAPSVSYTNQLPISTDTDGTIYNGIGYKENLRLSSSGEPTGQTNSYITGFIPYKYGDVVYLENVTFQSGITNGTTSSNQRLSFYDANKTHLGQTNATAAKNVCGGTLDTNNVYTSFRTNATTKNNISTIENVAYFRLNATYIGADSIITVNEPIE